jgi:hypothetical protein
MGFRHTLRNRVSSITGIDEDYLTGAAPIHHASVAKRMSWAAFRETTRDEDAAYALIGLFDVNLPMLYGEGPTKAFLRLQEEIMRTSEDRSLFAWVKDEGSSFGTNDYHGLLADSPRDFARTGNTRSYTDSGEYTPSAMTARGLHLGMYAG